MGEIRLGRELSFAADLKPLFRDSDREALCAAFDRWSVEDVRHDVRTAAAQLSSVESGDSLRRVPVQSFLD